MQLISFDKYDILELFLKNGFDVNRTLYFDGKEHNLLFYISERIHSVSGSNIHSILKYGINIDSKLKFNIDYEYRVQNIFGFYDKISSSKENSIFDLLIKKIINYNFEYHLIMFEIIFNYYCNIKENILLLKKCINNLNEDSFRILANDDDIKIIKIIKTIISFCYFNKDEFFKSIFFIKLSHYKLSYRTRIIINSIYDSNQYVLRSMEKRYCFNHFYELIKEKKYKKIKDVLDDMFDINYQVPDALKTPLMIASQYGINDKKLFDLLMKYNPNKDLQDKTNSTALHIACKYNNGKMIPRLVTEKNINMKDINGKTPLMIAVEEKSSECIKILLSDDCMIFNVDINVKDYNGNSPLVNVIIKFNKSNELEELIDLLIEKGADKDEVNYNNLTALYNACKYNHYKLIPKLIT